jgi:hypothetical protein
VLPALLVVFSVIIEVHMKEDERRKLKTVGTKPVEKKTIWDT